MPITEAGQAAQSFFEVMRSQPLALALVVMNFALLGYLFYTGNENNLHREKQFSIGM